MTFKAIGSAYAILSDPEKRARFDRGEIDATGAEKPPERNFYRDFGADGGHARYGGTGEVGTGLVAPAIANAIFRATGRRLRSMPFRKQFA